MKNEINNPNKGAKGYSEMIVSGKYPESVNLFHRNEINTLWEQGKTMAAIQKLQEIIDGASALNSNKEKTLL